MKILVASVLCFFTMLFAQAQDGHELWLRPVKAKPVSVICRKNSSTLSIAKQELTNGWQGDNNASVTLTIKKDKALKNDGFRLAKNSVQANTDAGILYGVYELLRRQQTGEPINNEADNPSYEVRILDHWDNLNGTIERGYAGNSIFWRKDDPFTVTERDKTLWQEYARANASIGINASVLDNVNASPLILSGDYLNRAKDIANVLRPYGIKVYLAVNFASPSTLGKLKTADPLETDVICFKWVCRF